LIKIKDELVNFPFIDLDALSKNKKFPENVKSAVALYNKALDRIKFNSTDIAMIELKKAIKIFPDFYDAILLLSLCHYAVDEKQKSISLLNTIKNEEERKKSFSYINYVVGKNISGAKPIRYAENGEERHNPYKRPHSGSNNRGGERQPARNPGGMRNPDQQRRNVSGSVQMKVLFKNLVNNPFVARLMILSAIFLIVVGLLYGIFTLYNMNSKNPNITQITDLQMQLNEAAANAKNANDKYQELKDKNSQLISGYLVDWLTELNLDNNKNYKQIVEIIYLIDTSAITDSETKDKINMINQENVKIYENKVIPDAELNILEGQADSTKLNQGISQLENVIKYCPQYENISKVMLELGKAYIKNNNKDKAVSMLNDLIKYHPDALEVTEAKTELDKLTGGN